MGKYFTVEVKPTIPNVAAGQHTAYQQDDLLFDWYAFDVPKGTSRLISADMEVRPKGDADSTVNEFDVDLLFAKTVNGNAPTSLGTVNSANSSVNSSNEIIGFISNGSWTAFETHLDSTAFVNGLKTTTTKQFFTGEPDSGTNVGYDRFYMAAIAEGAFDFSSILTINAGDLTGPVLTVADLDATLHLAVGDTLKATTTADTTVSKDMGVIKSIDSATQITLESAFTTAVVDNDFVYNAAPITFRLHFEK